MNNHLYEVLEECLQDVERGVDIETVLFRYPDLSDELRPILETAAKAIQVPIRDPSAEAVHRNRAKVLQHAAQLREAKSQPSRGLWSVSLRRTLVSLAVIAALFISSTSLVRAASMTLPGDNLYPVKRTWEDVRVLFTFDVRAREALEVEHENERLEELYEIFAEGRSTKVDFAGLVTRQNGDLWLVSKIPVVISPQTDLRDAPLVIGDAVRVRGVTQTDGTVLAERVDRLQAGVPLPEVEDDNSEDDATEASESQHTTLSLRGTVNAINGNIVIVNGQPMDISNAEVIGTAEVGRRARVQGYYADNGVFIVTRIEFIRIGSGDGNSGSNDNGSDDNDDNNDDNNEDNEDRNNDNSNEDNHGDGGNDNENSNEHNDSDDEEDD